MMEVMWEIFFGKNGDEEILSIGKNEKNMQESNCPFFTVRLREIIFIMISKMRVGSNLNKPSKHLSKILQNIFE